MSVVVAVVSWNTRALLERCLQALERDAREGRAEIWVVDNASSDGSADLAARHPLAQVVALDENVGFARAVDLVARQTRSAWIACANADVAPAPGAIARLLAAGDRDARVGAVAPRLVLPDGTTQHSVQAFPSLRRYALINSGLAGRVPRLSERLLLDGHWDPEGARHVDWAVGAFLLVRRDALEQAGGFGAQTELYAEDLDLAWRLRQAGWRIWYEPAAHVLHDESAATTKAWGERRHALRMAAGYRWLARRRGVARAGTAAALNVGSALGHAGFALVRSPRGTVWRKWLGEARLHLHGFRRGVLAARGGCE